MAKRKKDRTGSTPSGPRPAAGPVLEKPLRVAKFLCLFVVLIGVVKLILGALVALGVITEGWGFPMSAVPNWGRPWGVVLMLVGAAYVAGPVWLWRKPQRGSIVMMLVSGLSVLIGTPLITTSTEILYNAFRESKSYPEWSNYVWGYYMLLHIGIVIALYKSHPSPLADARAPHS